MTDALESVFQSTRPSIPKRIRRYLLLRPIHPTMQFFRNVAAIRRNLLPVSGNCGAYAEYSAQESAVSYTRTE